MSDSLWPHGLQHASPSVYHQLPEFTQTHIHCVGDAIQPSSSVVTFSSRLQSFPASGSFQMSQLFPSGGQSIGVSASTSVLPVNIQDWFILGWTGWIYLQCKGLKSLLQYHSSEASILWRSAFFIVQLSQTYMTTGKTSHMYIYPLKMFKKTQWSLNQNWAIKSSNF